MMSMIGLMGFAPFIFYCIIPLFAFAYLFLKWRSYKDGYSPDPDLGKKVILYYFKTISYHLILISLTLCLSSLIKWKFGEKFFTGLGIMISSFIIFIIHLFLINKIYNRSEIYHVSRFYNGFNLILVGLLGMVGIIITITLLIKGRFSDIQLPISALFVYGSSWLIIGYKFYKKMVVEKS